MGAKFKLNPFLDSVDAVRVAQDCVSTMSFNSPNLAQLLD